MLSENVCGSARVVVTLFLSIGLVDHVGLPLLGRSFSSRAPGSAEAACCCTTQRLPLCRFYCLGRTDFMPPRSNGTALDALLAQTRLRLRPLRATTSCLVRPRRFLTLGRPRQSQRQLATRHGFTRFCALADWQQSKAGMSSHPQCLRWFRSFFHITDVIVLLSLVSLVIGNDTYRHEAPSPGWRGFRRDGRGGLMMTTSLTTSCRFRLHSLGREGTVLGPGMP